jgi:hypothetical protein
VPVCHRLLKGVATSGSPHESTRQPAAEGGQQPGRGLLRVALVVLFFVVLVLFVLSVFFFVWLFSKEGIASYRPISCFWVEAFWI